MRVRATEKLHAEVIVVGAGPAGSMAAAALAERGRDVLLLDRCRFPRDKPCGEFVNPAGAAILHQMGVPLALAPGSWRPLGGLLLRAAGGASVVLDYPGTPPPSALSVSRRDLDATLLRHAIRAGARFVPGCQVEDLLWEDGRVAGVSVRSSEFGVLSAESGDRRQASRDGSWKLRTQNSELRTSIVVAADGAHSRLARRAGLARESRDRRFALVAHYRGVAAELKQVEMHALGWGYCGFALTGQGEATVAMVVRESELPDLRGRAAAFFEERLPFFTHISQCVRRAERTAPPRITAPVSVRARGSALPGLLLAGDAAGFFDPFTGRGITRALRSGRMAAEAVDETLAEPHRVCGPRYEARRRSVDAAWLVERVIRLFVDRPALLRYAVRCFQEQPGLGRTLLGVAGDLLPPAAVLSPVYLGRLLAAGPPPLSRRRDVWPEDERQAPQVAGKKLPPNFFARRRNPGE